MRVNGILTGCLLAGILLLSACSGAKQAASPSPAPSGLPMPSTPAGTVQPKPAVSPAALQTTDLFPNLSYDKITAKLDAEAPDSGSDPYAVIRKVLGSNAIEAPDQFDGKKHIFMDKDSIVGNHFYFVLHDLVDLDVTNLKNTDRQRNEIKVYDGSNENLKGRKDMTFTYRWKFKADSEMKASNRFTHIFQLKSTGSGEAPILTLTPRSSNKIELIHTDSKGKGTTLTTGDWTKMKGNWIQASVTATFSHTGKLSVTLKTLDGTTLLSFNKDNIDMWVSDKEFVRPKWGIYRGLVDGLNDAKVSFANFEIINHSLSGK